MRCTESSRRQKKSNDCQGDVWVGPRGSKMYAALRIIDRSIFHAWIFTIIRRQKYIILLHRSSSKTLIISAISHFELRHDLSWSRSGYIVEFRENGSPLSACSSVCVFYTSARILKRIRFTWAMRQVSVRTLRMKFRCQICVFCRGKKCQIY